MADLIAFRKYTDVEEQPEIINLHPQADVELPKKGRGRPKTLFQPAIIPEPESELIIHQHPAPEPEPEVKRKVGIPKKALQFFTSHPHLL